MTRIEQGQHLLKMIEGVDVKDTDTLDEIDARFWCFLNNEGTPEFKQKTTYTLGGGEVTRGGWGINDTKEPVWFLTEYTRSLDALHEVMPDGWYMSGGGYNNVGKFWTFKIFTWSNNETIYSRPLPTMHLAWLHAIIQAYIWEIENND